MTDETQKAPTDQVGPTARLASWIADVTVDQAPSEFVLNHSVIVASESELFRTVITEVCSG